MQALIGTELVRKLPLKNVDIRDTKLRGFVLRCRASGSHVYRVNLSRGRWYTLGSTDKLKPAEAREEARRQLAGDTLGRDPIAARRAARATLTLAGFITDHYEPWAIEHHKRGRETVQRLRTVFVAFAGLRLVDLTAWTVEKWRTTRLRQKPEPKPATVNSHVTMLRALLAKAVEWDLLSTHPFDSLKPLDVDKTGRVRYLTAAEEARLRAALTARDRRRRERQRHANTWRRERGYPEWRLQPDHLTTIVLLALNTGLRKGEIFRLRWVDVDFSQALVCVRGEGKTRKEGSKTAQTRYVSLNTEAVTVLQTWRAVTTGTDHVFPGRETGEALDDVKKAWAPVVTAAKIVQFTFHDLRHTFASKLVMAGVDLNTVRELLGHSDIKMTLRYAHLAAEHKAAAVAKLVAR